jgi:hypothetical protein
LPNRPAIAFAYFRARWDSLREDERTHHANANGAAAGRIGCHIAPIVHDSRVTRSRAAFRTVANVTVEISLVTQPAT